MYTSNSRFSRALVPDWHPLPPSRGRLWFWLSSPDFRDSPLPTRLALCGGRASIALAIFATPGSISIPGQEGHPVDSMLERSVATPLIDVELFILLAEEVGGLLV
ncbi:hypothetical protein GH714_008133 [Hevea brasiliensis]|uniref:Uncharacterized protein n=1 Tax=Hevea brasiliensis TaxID=3981 RepID=A0A6A6NCR0_HEVBR|nr:hypothetical protein GH714_008133 [Hevea brasiliensis]